MSTEEEEDFADIDVGASDEYYPVQHYDAVPFHPKRSRDRAQFENDPQLNVHQMAYIPSDLSVFNKRGKPIDSGIPSSCYTTPTGGQIVIDDELLAPHLKRTRGVFTPLVAAHEKSNYNFEKSAPPQQLGYGFQTQMETEEDEEEAMEDIEGGPNFVNAIGTLEDQKERQRIRFVRTAKAGLIAAKKGRQSHGGRKIQQALAYKRATNEDNERMLDDDPEGLFWESVLSPETELENQLLGPLDQSENCYACARGVGIQRVDNQLIIELRQVMLETFMNSHFVECCSTISAWFEVNIRQRCNSFNMRGVPLIQRWSASKVGEHLRYHTNEPTFTQKFHLDYWNEIAATAFRKEVFKVPVEAVRPGKKVPVGEIRLSKRGVDIMKTCTTMIASIQNWRTADMFNHNPNFSAPLNNRSFAFGGKNQLSYAKPASIFDEPNLDELVK